MPKTKSKFSEQHQDSFNPPFTKGFHKNLSGEKVQHYLFRAQSVSESKGAVLFVHATGNDGIFPQLPLLMALQKNGYDILSFDIDGHGVNSETLLNVSTVNKCVESAAKELKRRFSHKRYHLIGHSLGAALALNHARGSEDIQSLTLISLPLELKLSVKVALREISSILKPSFFGHVKRFGITGSLPALASFKRKQFPIRLADTSEKYLNAVREIIQPELLLKYADNITTTTLLVYGSKDLISSLEDKKKLADKISQSNSVIVNETHFTTVFSKNAINAILEFINLKS